MSKSRIQYMESRVPEIIKAGISMSEATTKASEEWDAKASDELEVCYEQSIEFTSEVTETGFKAVLQEEDIFPDMTFAQVFTMLKCEPGKRYEIEICVEEA